MSRGYSVIALDNPKTHANIGSVMRLAYNFESKMVVVSGSRYKKNPLDTPRFYKHNPILNVEDVLDSIPYDCVPVGVDLIENSRPLPLFTHPIRAYYIFGAEDATLGARILNRCKHIIHIPTNRCLNLAMAVSIVLYDRKYKEKLNEA